MNVQFKDIVNNLLCACISQPEYGFRYALMAWQMCLKYKIRPDLNMYELLLKAVKDCTLCIKKELVYLDTKKEIEQKKLIDAAESTPILSENPKDQNKTQSSKDLDVETRLDQKKIPVIKIEPKDVSVIDEFRLAGEQLEKEMRNLEWWQDIRTNVNRDSLLRAVSKIRPELKEAILARNFDSVLTRQLDDSEKQGLFEFVTPEDDTPMGRLLICTGGVNGLLKAMRVHSVKPKLKIFQLLIRVCVPL